MGTATRSKSKSSYHHGDLKPTLLAIARDIVQREGHEALTLRAVAQKAQVSQTAIYRHFESREQLLVAVVIYGLERLTDQTRAAMSEKDAPLDRFYAVGKAYVQFSQDNPQLYRLMFDAKIIAAHCEAATRASEESYGVLKSVIRQCQEQGSIRKDDIDKQAFSIWAAVHGIVTLCRDQAPTVAPHATPEVGFQMMWETCLLGLVNEPAVRNDSSHAKE